MFELATMPNRKCCPGFLVCASKIFISSRMFTSKVLAYRFGDRGVLGFRSDAIILAAFVWSFDGQAYLHSLVKVAAYYAL